MAQAQSMNPDAVEVRTAHGAAITPNGEPMDSFSRQLLAAMLAFRRGDFRVRLPSDTPGMDGKIAEAFNDILAVSERRATETERVCRVVGKEGKLKQRMSVPGAAGQWADEVASINTLIDDLVWPTTEVTRAVGAVAKGDLGQAMGLEVDGRPLEGEFLRSAKLVNRSARLVGPRGAHPINSVIDVATPVIVRTPLGSSSIYTPGCRRATGMGPPLPSKAGWTVRKRGAHRRRAQGLSQRVRAGE